MDKIKDTCEFLRGYFQDIYIGGSYATEQITRLPVFTIKSDIDIFILGPRTMESWALENLFNTYFDTVILSAEGDSYKIPNQFKRVTCYRDGIKYDLIFVDTDILHLITYGIATTFSVYFLKVNYSEEILVPVMNQIVKDSLVQLFLRKQIRVMRKSVATEEHINKMRNKAIRLGFDFHG